jgi:hypothetical protein
VKIVYIKHVPGALKLFPKKIMGATLTNSAVWIATIVITTTIII